MKFTSFFSSLQEAPWYLEFLNTVTNRVNANSILLDIGTGSGKMLQILAIEKGVNCIGVDTNEHMLDEAKKKLTQTKVKLIRIEPNKELPFENHSFEYVTICNVLFHLKKEDIYSILCDSLGLLKSYGKIIVLTPTGAGGFLKLIYHYFSVKNSGMFFWYGFTRKRALQWNAENYLQQYANDNQLLYQYELVMNGFACIETLSRKK